jgi:chromosome segregation ATPase
VSTPVPPPANAPNVTVQVNNPAPEQSPFGVEAQLQEVRRRLEDIEREMVSLKARQASAEARDGDFAARLAELVVAKESFERTAAELQRSQERSTADIRQTLKDFQAAAELQRDEDRETRKDMAKLATWRNAAMMALAAIGAALGGALIKLLERLLPALARHDLRETAENVVSFLL